MYKPAPGSTLAHEVAANSRKGHTFGLQKIGTKKIPEHVRFHKQTELEKAKATLLLATLPKSLPCRNKEMEEITAFIKGAICDDQCLGRCLYIHGVPGTGKTMSVLAVIRSLRSEVDAGITKPYSFVEINGLKLATPESINRVIYEALTGHRVSWKKALSLLNEKFSNGIKSSKDEDRPCILLIDELDLLVTRNQSVLYNILDWPTKKSESGSKNRCSVDSSGKSSRHTGGSMGYAERRARMKRKMNEEPNFKRIFLETHLTKKCKIKLWAGDIDIYNLKELTFCTERAKKAYADYLSAMRDVYGPDFKEYPDDPHLWARVHADSRTRRVYGVGSSDLEFLVTGTSSSSAGSALSHAEYQRSQEESRVMRTQIIDLEARLEEERRAREELQQQFQEFIKNWHAQDK